MQKEKAIGGPMTHTGTVPQQSRGRQSHLFFWSLFGAFGAAMAALVLLRMLPLPEEVLQDPQRRWILGQLPSDEWVDLKLRHARSNQPYDIGLFGNSRILMVGADELGLNNRRVFNFAIGGQSVRQSIRLLEELHASGKAPAIALISMDHVELGLPGGPGVTPRPPLRWLTGAADVWIAWRREGLRSAIIQTINSGAAEGAGMAMTFNHVFLLSKLRALAGVAGPSMNFRADGSQEQVVPAGPVTLGPLPRRADTYPQLESDFARLAAIRDSGVSIVVYESPVAPSLGGAADRELSSNARDVRRRFHEACAQHRLVCHGPPVLADTPWFDRDHAPAAQLAMWLRPLIGPKI